MQVRFLNFCSSKIQLQHYVRIWVDTTVWRKTIINKVYTKSSSLCTVFSVLAGLVCSSSLSDTTRTSVENVEGDEGGRGGIGLPHSWKNLVTQSWVESSDGSLDLGTLVKESCCCFLTDFPSSNDVVFCFLLLLVLLSAGCTVSFACLRRFGFCKGTSLFLSNRFASKEA